MRWDHLILPAITLGIRPLAIITQLTRSVLLEELGKDYIQTALAKGIKKTKVVVRHALRNAMNPIITAITGWFAELLAGAFFIEYIFGWKGLGKLTVEAVEQFDYPLVMGSVLVSSIIFIGIGIITDLLYLRLDPRVRL
jgi:peptide/nickel transport system permease protein